MNDRASIACSLSADDYQLRLAAIREIGDQAMLAAEDRPDGATLSFRNSREVHEKLAAIVRAESECCPFLVLVIDESRDRLALAVTAPPEALSIVHDLVRSFQGSGGVV
jgi:hypothetical protein